MIHIATVHWMNEIWIDIQLKYLEKYFNDYNYRIHAFLNGIDPTPYEDRIHTIRTDPIVAHIKKLDWLADYICGIASPEDIILFIDGDAFPIADIGAYLKEHLSYAPLVAVQRLENNGDPQPHPSFCATTVRFWKEIDGTWEQGPRWRTSGGRTRTDTGARLWLILKKKGTDWVKMLRTNRFDMHPLWFGVYEDLVYHHGAAFRTPYCSLDLQEAKRIWWKQLAISLAETPLGNIGGGWLQNAVYSYVMKERIQKSLEDSRLVLDDIRSNYHFAKRFVPNLYD